MKIYHMANGNDWAQAVATGFYSGSADDQRDGFIHFSTAEQLRESAARHRAGQKELLLLAIDSERLGAALKWEAARGGQMFPHLYGKLDPVVVVKTVPLDLASDGRHVFPSEIP